MKISDIKNGFVLIILLTIGLIGCEEDEPNVVLQPRTESSAMEQLAVDPELTMFVEALRIAGLDGNVQNTADITVFAPTNTAITSFLQTNGYTQISDVAGEDLANLLNYHIANSVVPTSSLISGGISTLLGSDIWALNSNDQTIISQSAVLLSGDDEVANGLIHKISSVIEPTGDYEKWKTSYSMQGDFYFFEDCGGALWEAYTGLSEGSFGVKQIDNFSDWGFTINVVFNTDGTLTVDSPTPSGFGGFLYGSGDIKVVGTGTWEDTEGEETFTINWEYQDIDNSNAVVDSCTHTYVR